MSAYPWVLLWTFINAGGVTMQTDIDGFYQDFGACMQARAAQHRQWQLYVATNDHQDWTITLQCERSNPEYQVKR